jgi:hypothetical protein
MKPPPPKTLDQLETELAAAKRVVADLKSRIWHEKHTTAKWNGEPACTWTPDPSLITRQDAITLCHKNNTHGFTRAKLASLGVPWPPPHGWKRALIKAAVAFHHLENSPAAPPPLVLEGRPKKWERDGFRRPIVDRFRKHVPSDSPASPPWPTA